MASLLARTALITGAGSGLGRAVATEFLKGGYRVGLVDIDGDKLKSTANTLSSLGHCLPIQADITDDKSAKRIFDDSLSKFGQVDALVNCAGIRDNFGGVRDTELDDWKRTMNVNLSSYFLLSKLAVNEFLREGRKNNLKGGAIVNISSLAGLRGGISGAAYAASKFGVLGLTKNTAALYSTKGVRCNAICPGGMETSFMAGSDTRSFGDAWSSVETISAHNPGAVDIHKLGRLIAFLCGDDGKDINGAIISVDNGWGAI